MKKFTCTRLRLCRYLIEQNFVPVQTRQDQKNPFFTVWLFDETPALSAALVQYFAVDCYTAKIKEKKG